MEYTLRYLPIAKQDLSDAINFILNEYKNPIAAESSQQKGMKKISYKSRELKTHYIFISFRNKSFQEYSFLFFNFPPLVFTLIRKIDIKECR